MIKRRGLYVVLLSLLCAALLEDARAQISCAAGQTLVHTVTFVTTGTTCSMGSTFPTATEMEGDCLPSHGAAAPGSTSWHWTGNPISPSGYGSNGTQWSGYSNRHNSLHGLLASPVRYVGATVTCTAPTCNEQADGLLDLPDPLNTPAGTPLCINNCNCTGFSGLQITSKEGGSGLIAFCKVNSPATACSTSNVTEPQRERTCRTVDGKQICAYTDNPDAVGDGFIDEPSPTPDNESATLTEQLETDQCVRLPSGGGFCTIGATNAPDNGTPGVPATPDAQVQMNSPFGKPGGVGTTYNYYSSTTYNNATNGEDSDPTEGGPVGGGGDCDPATEECEEGPGGDISGGETCATAPVCSNDPIQCYHSTRLWEMKCALAVPDEAPLHTAIDAGATDGLAKPLGAPLIDQIGDDFDVSTWWSPGSASTDCPTDVSITHFLGAVVIPLSDWCGVLHAIGFFVLISAALASFRVFAQGFA